MQIKLQFLGAAQNVTGSRYLLESDGIRVLIDCGLYQERHLRKRNWAAFDVPPSTINAVLLTHAHLDHCGLLPKLVKEGFQGKIYCTEATADIAEIVLLDSAHIQQEDAEFKRKRHKREGRKGPYPEMSLYNTDDAQETLPLFSRVNYEQTIEVADGIEASFYDAGHIFGASIIKVTVKQNGQKRSILFSGDIGRKNKPILQDPTVFNEADYVLVESTYGDRTHGNTENIKDEFCEVINSTYETGGNLIVPSFSIERSQEILYYFNELLIEDKIPHIKVFLDSPMAVKVTKVFEKHPELFDEAMAEFVDRKKSPFCFPGLKMVDTPDESKAINRIKGTVCIIAGSGMCTGGRIKHHLIRNISRPESTVLFVGYQAVGTLGRNIAEGAKEVRIFGQNYTVKARVATISGWSAHADREELLRWLSYLKTPPRGVFVVHGESSSAQTFRDYLSDKTGWNISAPIYKDEIILD